MQTVILKPLYHREEECIGIYFENISAINMAIRKDAGARWSQSKKVWYVPLSKQNYNKLFFALKGKASIEQEELHKYLANKKIVSPDKKISLPQSVTVVAKPSTFPNISDAANKNLLQRSVTIYKTGKIHPVNAHVIPAMQQHLKLKAYSPSTIKTYLGEITLYSPEIG